MTVTVHIVPSVKKVTCVTRIFTSGFYMNYISQAHDNSVSVKLFSKSFCYIFHSIVFKLFCCPEITEKWSSTLGIVIRNVENRMGKKLKLLNQVSHQFSRDYAECVKKVLYNGIFTDCIFL
jgi:hypothetical protein